MIYTLLVNVHILIARQQHHNNKYDYSAAQIDYALYWSIAIIYNNPDSTQWTTTKHNP